MQVGPHCLRAVGYSADQHLFEDLFSKCFQGSDGLGTRVPEGLGTRAPITYVDTFFKPFESSAMAGNSDASDWTSGPLRGSGPAGFSEPRMLGPSCLIADVCCADVTLFGPKIVSETRAVGNLAPIHI